jgi:hypothetical protein
MVKRFSDTKARQINIVFAFHLVVDLKSVIDNIYEDSFVPKVSRTMLTTLSEYLDLI